MGGYFSNHSFTGREETDRSENTDLYMRHPPQFNCSRAFFTLSPPSPAPPPYFIFSDKIYFIRDGAERGECTWLCGGGWAGMGWWWQNNFFFPPKPRGTQEQHCNLIKCERRNLLQCVIIIIIPYTHKCTHIHSAISFQTFQTTSAWRS